MRNPQDNPAGQFGASALPHAPSFPAASGAHARERSFGWHLGVLVLGLLIPAILSVGLLLDQFGAAERRQVEAQARHLARTLAIAVDREIDGVSTTLQALGTSPSLTADDQRGFYQQMQRVRQMQGLHLSLRTSGGETVLTTRLPYGERILNVPDEVRETDRAALEGRATQVSDLFVGPVTGTYNLQVVTPVLARDPPDAVLGASLDTSFFRATLDRFEREEGWTAAIIDANGSIVARLPGHDLFVGKPAPREFLQRMGGARGFHYAGNMEGVPSLVAHDALSSAGWRVAVSLPSGQIDRQLLRSLLWLGGLGLFLGSVGLSLALIVRGRLQRAVDAVDRLAAAMREGRPATLAPTEVAEIRRVGQALFDASADLRQSEGRLRAVLDNLFVFVGLLDVEGRVLQTNQAPLAILDLKPSDVRGVLFWECPWWTLSAETQDRVRAAVQAAARGEWVRFDIDVRTSGGPITIDFQLAPLRDVEGRIVGLQPSGVDITERVRAQAELARREARNAFLAELREKLDQAANPEEVLRIAAKALEEHLGVDVVAVHELNLAADEARVHAAKPAPGLKPGVYSFSELFSPPTRQALLAGEVPAIRDVREDPRTADRRQRFEEAGAIAVLAAPLARRGELVGAFVLAHGAPRVWDDDVELIRVAAERVWNAFETARLMRDLAAGEARLQAGVAVAGLGLGGIDYLRGAITLDARAAALFALPADEPLPRAELHARFHPEDAPALVAAIEALVGADGAGRMALEHRLLRPDGSVVWLSAHKQITYGEDAEGRRRAVSGVLAVHDVTQRKEAEIALRQSEGRLRDSERTARLAIDAAAIGLWDFDPAAQTLSWDARTREIFGVGPDDPVSYESTYLAAIHPEDRPAVEASIAAALNPEASEEYEVELRIVRARDGAERWVQGRGQVLFEEGVPVRFVGTVRDISAQKEAERALRTLNAELESRVEERTAALRLSNARLAAEMERREAMQATLVQSQKLEAIGQLTSGIAHDFNNSIAAIAGGFSVIQRRTDDPRILDIAKLGVKAAERGGTLVKQLLAFARQQALEPRAVDLAEHLTEADALLRRSVGPKVQLTIELEPDLPQALVDPVQLETALINLAVNARDAMPKGGVLHLAVRACPPDQPGRPHDLGDRDAVAITMSDSGVGMAPEVLQRVMEPFFTTKGPGKGTGLGLAMVHGFVHQSKGALRIESRLGLGTSIRLYLPTAKDGEPAQPAREDRIDPSLHGHATLLLVDDDDAVRGVLAAQLRDLRYTVIEAKGGEAALLLLRQRPDVEAVISDVGMPGMDGPAFVEAARVFRPSLPVLFMTGQLERERIVGETVLDKPFGPPDLARAVLDLLARGANAASAESDALDRLAGRFRSQALREMLARWRKQRDGAGPPLFSAFDPADCEEPGRIVIAEADAGHVPLRFRFASLGPELREALAATSARALEGAELPVMGDDSFATQEGAYRRCVRTGRPVYDYVRSDLGDGEPEFMERLLLPYSTDGALADRVVGIVLLACRPGVGRVTEPSKY